MSITATSVDKPTVILVHGAFAESSSWNGVIAPLLDDGYPVLAVANPPARRQERLRLPAQRPSGSCSGPRTRTFPRPPIASWPTGRFPADRGTPGRSHAVAIPEAAAVVDLIREAATGGAAR